MQVTHREYLPPPTQDICTHKHENQLQAGGDTAQTTDFTQTQHKCWVWWVNDHGKKLGQNILIPPS